VSATRLTLMNAARAERRAPEQRELCVVLACHEVLLAMPVRAIERLVLPEEVKVAGGGGGGGGGGAAEKNKNWQIVMVGEQKYAACNLGTLLGVAPLEAAWALLRVKHKGAELPLALQTGACQIVQPLTPGITLPGGVFRARSGAISAAFSTAMLKGREASLDVGLWLDPERLWHNVELDSAAVALEEHGRRG